MVCDGIRSFPSGAEYLSFYTFQDITGTEMLSDKISSKNPMAKYLLFEFKRSNVKQSEIRQLFLSKTGGETGCVTNWLKGYNFPLKEQYNKIKKYLNRDGGDYLRQEYESLRYPFNSMTGFTDVWQFNFYKEKRHNHPTQKPFELIERIVLTSSNKGDLVVDPCMGTGTALKVCKAHDRNFKGAEINPKYDKTIQERADTKTPKLDKWGKL